MRDGRGRARRSAWWGGQTVALGAALVSLFVIVVAVDTCLFLSRSAWTAARRTLRRKTA